MTMRAAGDGHLVQLPPVLDLKAADALLRDFRAARGQAVTVDASQVQRLGGLCLQVLLSAQGAWEADGKALDFADCSAAFRENLKLLGADELIDLGETS